MDYINEFADQRQQSWCIHCTEWINANPTNSDHVPSKTLLRKPYPDNLPVVEICKRCNNSFSADEEYLSLLLRCILAGTTDPNQHADERAARALRRHEKLRAQIERSKRVEATENGPLITWQPDYNRINRVVLCPSSG